MLKAKVILGLLAGLVCAGAFGQVITTIAGGVTPLANPSQSALKAPLGLVTGLASDASGNIYAADGEDNLVVRISPDGNLTIVAGNGVPGFSGDGGPATKASLFDPSGVAVDAAGNVFIADAGSGHIRRVANGTITSVAGTIETGKFSGDGGPATNASLNFPMGVAVDAAGTIYIADSYNNRIRKIQGGIITTIAGSGAQGFSGDGGPATNASLFYPEDIAIDAMGNLYVADSYNRRIRRVANGIITTFAGGGTLAWPGDGIPANNAALTFPYGVALDSAGNLYIADQGQNRIRKVTNGTITTVAGSGNLGFSGDGGPATNATLYAPYGVTVDAAGNLYIADTLNARIRKVVNGTILTVAGLGRFSGDGGAATLATLFNPSGLALDTAGNLYIADTLNDRIRRITKGIITTVAGNGNGEFSGDGGPATSASLYFPESIALDQAGNLYIADAGNFRIRKVVNGTITTIAGTGNAGFSGDGGPATSALLNIPRGVAVDAAGNLFIADSNNHRVRKVSNGTISTVAGSGVPGIAGDGGPATNASLGEPYGVVVDSAGNLYITDTQYNLVRKVVNGTISTIAGNGNLGFSGDDGPAASALLNAPKGIAVDASGDVYIADSGNGRVRKIVNGTITTVAGIGGGPPTGDGGPATSAGIGVPYGVAVDALGNLYSGDQSFSRVREVLSAVSYRVTPATLSFSGSGAQTLGLSSTVSGLPFTASTSASWLSVSPISGSIPAQIQVSVDTSNLGQGTYQGTVTITVPSASPATMTIPVTLMVGSSAGAPAISADPASLSFSFTQGAVAGTTQLTVSTAASGPFSFNAAASTTTGGNWLKVSPGGGSVTGASPISLTVTATPGSLAVSTYSGVITITSSDTGQTLAVPVTMAISAPPQKIVLSQLGFTFTAVAQGGTVLPQALGILNTGAGTLNWTASVTTLPPASGWLSLSATSGTVTRPFLDVSFTNVIVNAGSLAPGAYYGQIQVSATGASNSPQTALVVLTVLPPGSNPGPDVRPTGLVFTGVAGAENPGSQNVTVANVTANSISFISGLVGGNGIQYLPTDASISPDTPIQIVVQPNFASLSAGVSHATLTLQFPDGSAQTVSILTVLAPAGTLASGASPEKERTASGCAPTKLIPQFTQIGFATNASVSVGFPATVSARIVDDCGSPMTTGSVVVSFSNGDPPLSLNNLQNGNWINSWQPTYPSAGVTLSLKASEPTGITGSLASFPPFGVQQSDQNPPVLSGVPESVGTLTAGAFAPGDLILIQGSSLADGVASSSSTPLKQQLAGASIVVGGRVAPLLYADAGQVVGLIPTDTPVNTSQQVILQRDNILGIPTPLIIAATHPAVLTNDGSGQGQGLIYKANGSATTLADVNHPVNPGDTIIIYCTGLGATDANGNASNKVAVSIGGQTAQVSYAGVALPQNYPTGGAPTLLGVVSAGLGGLYQVTATVPGGVSGSQVAVSISSAGQISQSGVTVAIGGVVTGTPPVVNAVITGGGFPDVAQNDWIEIHGTNLAPASVGPNGMTWDNAPDFASGRMPAQLGGVSVTVNNKPAFIYYVSANQVNVLTPLDNTVGPVKIIVTSGGVSSPPFTVNMRAAAPSFPLFGGSYIVAEHGVDYSLLGPTSLSIPGYPFTPAKPGETVLLYAFGFALPTTTLVNGSSSQFGPLPAMPVIEIGGLPANVVAAYVISPGLYQFNIVVPAAAPDGDNFVTCTYMGQTSPAGDLLTVQH